MATDSDTDRAVDVRHLTKVFRDFWRRPKVRAVDGLDLAVGRGEVFGLLGPNGSGKSTTLRIVLGLLYPTSGTVRVLGKRPGNVEVKRRIGYLPEESYLYHYLTPRETLNFYGRLLGLDRRNRVQRTAELLSMLDLEHAGHRPVGEFSKGMARRVGLGQALINDPELIFLDEPTSGLDPIGCRQVKDLIGLLRERGKTIVLCSHLLADVEDVCDRVAILYNGRLRAEGAVRALLEKKDKTRVTFPSLPPEALKQVLTALRERVGEETELDHPSINLEQFFVDVIAEAHRKTGKAFRPEAQVAPFLRDGTTGGPDRVSDEGDG